MRSLQFLVVFLGVFIPTTGGASGAEPFRYKQGEHGKGKLTFVKDVPVLILEGSPDEMGEQTGVLAVQQAKPLFNFPRDYFRRDCTAQIQKAFPKLAEEKVKAMEEELWPKFQNIAAKLEENSPDTQKRELLALIKAGKVDSKQLIAANGAFDLGNLSPQELFAGCSSVVVPPKDSDTSGLLFGRNLDFSHLGYLHRYSLLLVYRSNDPKRHSFVSAGFPGFVGCFTGMNDAGLTIASHEVFEPNTKTLFNPKGVPFAMAYRRVLEECETIDDAVKLLKGIQRASVTSLVIADAKEGAVIEVTPDTIAVRRFENKPGVCTNHFCTKEHSNQKQTDKFSTLKRFGDMAKLVEKVDRFTVADVQKCLHAANMQDLTIQTFVFEPKARKVHLRFGNGEDSTTKGELTTIDLNKLWAK